jgi:single-strand DNA-binding protein
MNSVNLTGNLTKDPEPIRGGGGEGRDGCKMRIGLGRGRHRNSVYIDVKVFGPEGPRCLEHLHRGRGVAITGWLELAEWKAEDGSKRTKLYVSTNSVDFLGRRGEEPSGDGASAGLGSEGLSIESPSPEGLSAEGLSAESPSPELDPAESNGSETALVAEPGWNDGAG